MGIVSVIAKWAANPWVVGFLFAAIVVTGVAFGVLFSKWVNGIKKMLDEAIEAVSGHDGDLRGLDPESETAEKRKAFVKAYPEISQKIQNLEVVPPRKFFILNRNGKNILRHAWNEFDKTIIKEGPDSGEQPKTYQNTIRPQQYLNMEVVFAAGFPPRWYATLPNWFIAVGLLLTFGGLLLALSHASSGVAGEIEQAKKSLEALLGAATLKFSTSVVGFYVLWAFRLNTGGRFKALRNALKSWEKFWKNACCLSRRRR